MISTFHQHPGDLAMKGGTATLLRANPTTPPGRRPRAQRLFQAITTPFEESAKTPRSPRRWQARVWTVALLAGLIVHRLTAAGAVETNAPPATNEFREVEGIARIGALTHSNEFEPLTDPTPEPLLTNDLTDANGVVPAGDAPRQVRRELPPTGSGKPDQRAAPAQAASPPPTVAGPASPVPTGERSRTNALEGPVTGAQRVDYTPFKIIADRNIFDPNRVPHRPDAPRSRPKVTEYFAFCGFMSYTKGTFALFRGSSPSYTKGLTLADTIAGYKVMDIEPNVVKLAAGTNQVELRIGMSLRREEGGDWLLATQAEPYATSGSVGPTSLSAGQQTAASQPGASSGGDLSEIEKRMMQRREQQ